MFASEMIRDVSRALPWLAAESEHEPIPAGVSLAERKDILDVHAEGLRRQYDHLYPVIDLGGHKLAAAFEEPNPDAIVDPEGKGAEALEKAEAHFDSRRVDLSHMRKALVEAGAPHVHNVFEELDRLDELYAWLIATMQKVRWTVLIADGRLTPPNKRKFTSGSELVATLDQ